MTISSEGNINTYPGDGADTTFDFTFPILDESHLEVEVVNDTTGVVTTKTLTTHYTVSGSGNTSGSTDYTSGTVTFGTAPASGETVVIRYDIPITQAVDLQENDNFPAETIEDSLDKLTMIASGHQEQLDNAVRINSAESGLNSTIIKGAPAAYKVIALDSGGDDLTWTGISDLDGYTVLDEDDMASDSATAVPTQQSVKAYVLATAAGITSVVEDTTPQLGGQLDVNGNAIGDGTRELLTFTEDASAVNHVNIENEATGSGPIIRAAGDDSNVDLNIQPKGTGNVTLSDGTDTTKKISVELSGATTSTATTLTASQTSNRTITLPDATDTLVGKATTDTLTNKSISLTTNTLTGTTAEFNTALSDGSFATLAGSETLTNKTLTSPTINGANLSGGTATLGTVAGAIDAGSATSLEIPNSATPSISVDGQIAIDTTVTDFSHGILKYYSGEEMAVVAVPVAQLTSPTDTYVIKYNATNDEFELAADAGAGGGISNLVEDTTPQLGGQLDVNGNAIGDGTNELLTFTEDASAVNHVNIENEATGSGPIIRSAGDDTNVDLNIDTKGTGALNLGSADSTIVLTGTSISGSLIKDEDNMSSDSATHLATQQSIKAYADTKMDLSSAQEYTATKNFNMTSLTSSAASIAWDASANQVATHTATENTTLANPTNMVAGATYIFIFVQHASSAKTLAFGSAYKWPGGTAPTVSTGASAVDVMTFVSDGTNMYGSYMQDMS